MALGLLERFKTIGLALASISCLSGCVHIAKVFGLVPEKPKMEFASITIQKMSFTKVELEVGIDITNRDKRELELNNLQFELKFDTTVIGNGKLDRAIRIDSGQKSRAVIPVSIKVGEAALVTASLLNGSNKDQFRIVGLAEVGSIFGSIEVPFDHPIVK
jgi:LEA14-like dessication related protein